MQDLRLTSPVFEDGSPIPAKYTSDGDNLSPPLEISGVGEEAKSLVLIVDDPDAATDPDGPGKTFDHWVLFNIPPEVTEIAEARTPDRAVSGSNGMGRPGYVGPAPPNGTHRYYFRLYELSEVLELNEGATKEEVENEIRNYTLRKTVLMGTYKRKSS